jgi:UDP-glucuronate 4-epimerase
MGSYLVTGVAGFIGSKVAEFLLKDGHQVHGLDNLNDAYDPRLKDWRLERIRDEENLRFDRIDIVDHEALAGVWLPESYDAVINLAARAGVRPSVAHPEIFLETNVFGALNLLELARERGVKKFVLASTSSLYGEHNPMPFQEDADISRPLSPYASSKGAAEMLCHNFHHLHGLDVSILRYFTVYGPAGRPDMSIFRFIQWVAEGRPLRLYGDGFQERDFTFIDDIARGTIAALKPLGFEVINLGSDHPVQMNQVISLIEGYLEERAKVDRQDVAPGDIRATWADIHKAKDLLGWEPEVPFDAGLKAAVDWYLQERSWASTIGTQDI